ncbi:MAG: polysaccharide deacetylase family protein [Candidatus Uhrbacteria bacterium]|nr:polysaccharide deacetylase family protein [Candidatus Uhrbacteria bacterium]
MAGIFLFIVFQTNPRYEEKSLTEGEKQSAGPSEQFAESQFTKRLPVAKNKVNPNDFVVPILMYHHIGVNTDVSDKIRDDLTVPPDQFEAQVAWLAKNKYHSVTLEDVYLHAEGKLKLPSNPIVFTFDDGYDDAILNAVPILKKYGDVGSFAIITQWPGTTSGSNTYATWDQIKTAMNQGMEIVSHTQNHFDGTNPTVTKEYVLKDLKGSVMDLKNHLGISSDLLIYPYGHYNADYIAAAEEAGFVMGVTVHEGAVVDPDVLMEIPRIRVHGREELKRFQNILWGAKHVSL